MSTKVLYFASLRESIGRDQDSIELKEPMKLEELWKLLTGLENYPDDILVAVNQEYSNKQTTVSDGDEVAFFPPVTGG